MLPKFCPNLSFLFTEVPFLKRYEISKDCGFKAVETGFPFGFSVDEVSTALKASGLEQILINTYTGDVTKGEFGCAAVPGKEDEFIDNFLKTIEYALALKVKKIHIMAGVLKEGATPENDVCFKKNMRYAASVLEKENIIGVIEPINKYSIPNYYMNSYDLAMDVIKTVNSPNLKLMMDIYHMQIIRGDITNGIKELMPYIGHVQIAQVPNRNEPDTAGELSMYNVLDTLDAAGYKDWIGLEYKPLTDTVSGLKWFKKFGFPLKYIYNK